MAATLRGGAVRRLVGVPSHGGHPNGWVALKHACGARARCAMGDAKNITARHTLSAQATNVNYCQDFSSCICVCHNLLIHVNVLVTRCTLGVRPRSRVDPPSPTTMGNCSGRSGSSGGAKKSVLVPVKHTASSGGRDGQPWHDDMSNAKLQTHNSFAFARFGVASGGSVPSERHSMKATSPTRSGALELFVTCGGYKLYHRISSMASNAGEVRFCVEAASGTEYAAKVIPRIRRLRRPENRTTGTDLSSSQRSRAPRASTAAAFGLPLGPAATGVGRGRERPAQLRRAERLGVSAQAAVEIEALQRLNHPNVVR